MPTSDSVAIDNVNVVSVAREASANAKLGAAMMFLLAGLFVFAGISVEAKHGLGTTLGGFGFWVVLLGGIGWRFLRGSRRAEAAIRSIEANSPHQFYLSGRMIVVATDTGALRPEMSFKISKKLRSMLLAVPRASIHRA